MKLNATIVIIFLFVMVSFTNALSAENGNQQKEISILFDQSWDHFSMMHKDIIELDKAMALIEKVLAIDSMNYDVYWKMAEITFKKADEEKNVDKRKSFYTKTLAYAEKAVEISPDLPEGHYWIGIAVARLAEMSGPLNALGFVKRCKKELNSTIEASPVANKKPQESKT